MKRLIIAVFCLGTLITQAQITGKIDSTVSHVVAAKDSLIKGMNDSTKLTWLKVYEDTKEGIASLGKALKIPAEHVYGVLVRQQIVKAVTWLVFVVVFLILLRYYVRYVRWTWNMKEEDKPEEDGVQWVAPVLLGIAAVVTFFIAVSHLDIITTGLINPEYGAIQDIWNFVKH